MELFYELLLTAAATLLAAFLLATLFAANDPPRERERRPAAAAAIAREAVEEERIIEVDEVKKLSEGGAAAERRVEVDKAPAVVVEEAELPGCAPEEEEVPVKAARGARVGAVLVEEEEDGGGAEKRCDLAPAAAVTGVVVEPTPLALCAEDISREALDVVRMGEESAQDVQVKQHDLGAEVAPTEVPDVGSEEQGQEVVEVPEVSPVETEAVEVKHYNLATEVAPIAEVLDRGLEQEKTVQAVEAGPDELAAETAPEEIPYTVLEKKEEQVVDMKEHELAVESAPQPVLDVTLAEKEELKDQQPVDEAVDGHEVLQSKGEAKYEAHPVDQLEELVPVEELAARIADDVELSHEGSSSDQVVTELPVEEGVPVDDPEAGMDFGEWEGIERSEVEKRFGAAAAFAASGAGAAALSKLDSDVQLQLQGLLKVAIDGPCYDSTQPLTLRPSSRAKWLAWQKLGNMHPEIAMEKYMNLLSETIPGWMGNETLDTEKHGAGRFSVEPSLTKTSTSYEQSNQGNEDSATIDEGHLITSPNPEKGQSSDIPAE